jgi:septum formation protein
MLVLASRSPQRRELLERLGVRFVVRPVEIDELERGEPATVAVHNALAKAHAAAAIEGRAGAVVLGVDTLVALDGTIHGKPADADAARATLRALSGRTHTVVSGLALLPGEGPERTASAITQVRFRALDGATVDWYLASGEWRERAGGYAIQGAGVALVERIEGDYANVVGLPLAALLELWPDLLTGRQ